MKSIATALFLLALSVPMLFAQETQKHANSKPVTAEIINAQGQNIGTATLFEAANGVRIKLDIKNLPPGPHIMHIHEFSKCEPPDVKSAGAHFNPTDAPHSEHTHASMP